MSDLTGRFLAGTTMVCLSAGVMYQACQRASTIYFFEMGTVNTIFIDSQRAALFPLVLSLFVYLAYWTTKRTLIVEEKLKEQRLKEKTKSMSRLGSRKASHSMATGDTTRKTSFSSQYTDENMAEQAKRLKRLLSAIEEQDTIHATRGRTSNDEEKTEEAKKEAEAAPPHIIEPPARFTVEKVDIDKIDSLRCTSDPTGTSGLRPRTSSNRRNSERYGDEQQLLVNDVCEDTPGDPFDEEDVDPYRRLADLDSCAYFWSILNLSPTGNTEGMSVMDVVSELVAVHIPIWGCVVALYVVLLELLNIKLAYYFYYHGSFLGYGALLVAIACGLLHEFKSNWITNNILAFSCVYVSISRFQAVGYQTSVIFVIGIAAIDLFWYYVIDILSTVMQNVQAPLFIAVPCDLKGNTQRVSTATVITPAVLLGVVLKYSSMYDAALFPYTFYAVVVSFAVIITVDIVKGVMLPGIVLPAMTAVVSSLAIATHSWDLWRFMVKH